MTVTVSGNKLIGHTAIIASKSVVHRLLICAALCDSPTVIHGVGDSQDIDATVTCLRASLADIEHNGNTVTVIPRKDRRPVAPLDCGESGSTLRFLIPIMAALGGAQFIGRGRLAERPLGPIVSLLEQHGCRVTGEGHFPLTVSGQLRGDTFEIDGTLSSQFVSGLLMAAPLMGERCRIRVTGEITSLPYLKLTIQALARFGIRVVQRGNTFTVIGRYASPAEVKTEGDWSNAAFWLVGAAISQSDTFRLQGVWSASRQGDKAVIRVLRQAGFTVAHGKNGWLVRSTAAPKAVAIDARDIPDLVPILAVLATRLNGTTDIYGAARLIHKESNRLESVHAMLTALGGNVEITEDGLRIVGGRLRGGVVNGYNDHRIVMAAATAALVCDKAVTIVGAEAVAKSYPTFFEELEKRGMQVCQPSWEEN